MENTYFRALKKIVLIHRTLLAKNVIFLEMTLVFSENNKIIQKLIKIIKHGSEYYGIRSISRLQNYVFLKFKSISSFFFTIFTRDATFNINMF